MLSIFLESLKKKNPKMAEDLMPYIDDFLSYRASIYTRSLMPDNFNAMGRIPIPETNSEEQQLDNKDFFDWEMEHLAAMENRNNNQVHENTGNEQVENETPQAAEI